MINRTEIIGWQQFQAKLKRVPEKVRQKHINRILTREARPLVWAARRSAYDGAGRVKKKRRGKHGADFYNLYKTIDVFANSKKKDLRYVVVGLRATNKKKPAGAYYAPWQLRGGTEKDFKAKDFFTKAEQQYGEQVSTKALRAVNKEVEKVLNTVFTRT